MPRTGFVEVEGGSVFYVQRGEGEGAPLLCLHGGPGFPHNYVEPLARLGDHHPVIFYDQLGCGQSHCPRPSETLWRVERFVEEVHAVREHLGLDRMHLFGHSWGGCLAATYALAHPDGLVSLVLASPLISTDRWLQDASELRAQLPAHVRETLDRHERDGFTDCPEYIAATLEFYKRHFCRLDPWPEPLEKTWAGAGRDVYVGMWGPTEFYATGTLRGYDLSGRLAELRVPTLFTCGQYDEARPDTVTDFAQRVPGADVVVIEKSSHTPHLEAPGRYIEVVGSFLDGTAS
jgi:proline iminopeptidase